MLHSAEELIAAARAGDDEAFGALLEKYRDRFRIIAGKQLDSKIQQRVDPSDVIQQSFFEAKEGFPAFRGNAEAQFVAWLKRILENNLCNTIEYHVRTGKRSVFRERTNGGRSSQQCRPDLFPGSGSSPSHRLIRSEEKQRVLRGVDQLPENQR